MISLRGFPDLRKVGFYLFGEEVDQHVPLLQSRVIDRPPATPTTPPPANTPAA